ncbi:MAG: arginine--tRNA ligase [Patescibacteria group bacterium]
MSGASGTDVFPQYLSRLQAAFFFAYFQYDGEVKNTLYTLVIEALQALGVENQKFTIEHPTNLAFGDYSTNAGIISKKPQELADYLDAHKPTEIEKIEVKNGFINFYLSKEFFKKSITEIIEQGNQFGRNESVNGEKVIVEHTDPNPFKPFHIGHLMPNVVGSTLARIYEWNGAEVKQACYQGDVGIHVAKAIWGLLHGETENAYPVGNKAFEESEESKAEIKEINKKIYDRSDEKINELYDQGRKASLDYFDSIYTKLGTKFDYFFFESETAGVGKEIVESHPEIFEKSEGAIVFHAENHDKSLHTRVFINSEGLPTYETKELGLAKVKAEKYPYTKSIVVTGNEIVDYFKVLLQAMKLIYPDLREKTVHISHGMLRLPTGKMSSRTGDVITFEELLEQVKEKIAEKGDLAQEEVAIGAIKYMILRSNIGSDIVFDIEKSVSTEGDSGVYLQYSYARTNSLLEKASAKGGALDTNSQGPALAREMHPLEKLLYRFPEVVERAQTEHAPNLITTFLTELAGSFSNLYASEQIISDSPESPYLIAVTKAFNTVMKNGLTILGIPAPEKM